MRYGARLARLERLVGKGVENCPRCRIKARHTWDDPRKPPPAPPAPSLEVYSECEMCGGRLRHDLTEYAGRERELARLYLTSRIEDFYTDPRAWAALMWYLESDNALVARGKQLRERRRLGQPQSVRAERRREQGDGPGEKLYDRLLSEWLDFITGRHRRLSDKFGAPPFPELAAGFDAITHVDRKHLYKGEPFAWRVPLEMFHLEQEETAWLRCAEAERLVLGEALASTRQKIEDCGRRALDIIDEARRRHEEAEEDERRRREEDERRHREYLESIRAASAPAAPAPPPDPHHVGGEGLYFPPGVSEHEYRLLQSRFAHAASTPRPRHKGGPWLPGPRQRWKEGPRSG